LLQSRKTSVLALFAALLAAGCTAPDQGTPAQPPAGGTGPTSTGTGTGTQPGVSTDPNVLPDGGTSLYEPVSASASVAKVKQLLVGLAPTDAEVQAVAASPAALRTLIQGWMALPQFAQKQKAFFMNAFQQKQIITDDFNDQLGLTLDARALPGMQESFARTVQQLIAEGRPFTEVMTTQRFMLTPALMAAYALADVIQWSDTNVRTNYVLKANSKFQFKIQAGQGPIPLSDSLDPASPNYMVFYHPVLAKGYDALCPQDNIVYASVTNYPDPVFALYQFLMGAPQTFNIVMPDKTLHSCQPPGTGANGAYLAPGDFNAWQMVKIRKPKAGEATTKPWDLPTLRAANELVLNIPRVGFFTTPAFFAGWQTNNSNQMRVTLNQTMIVALGQAIDLANTTAPPSLAAVDTAHAAVGTACYNCHQSLDPLRQFFRHEFTYRFGNQTDTAQLGMTGQFAFFGVSTSGPTIFDLGAQLAAHPYFGPAWVQKLCLYANSDVCNEDDPEFLRVVQVFSASGYSWSTLIAELFSSPLVTYGAATASTAGNGEMFPIARRDHLCVSLSARLGINDVCGLDAATVVPAGLATVKTIAATLPSDQYSRGGEDPELATDPSPTLRSGMENLCATLAAYTVDNGATSKYKSTASAAAISDFVHNLMGITTDRDATPLSILNAHYTAAIAAKASASDALKSTFVLACLSPSVVGLGQ
jgi:hypothetical protein